MTSARELPIRCLQITDYCVTGNPPDPVNSDGWISDKSD